MHSPVRAALLLTKQWHSESTGSRESPRGPRLSRRRRLRRYPECKPGAEAPGREKAGGRGQRNGRLENDLRRPGGRPCAGRCSGPALPPGNVRRWAASTPREAVEASARGPEFDDVGEWGLPAVGREEGNSSRTASLSRVAESAAIDSGGPAAGLSRSPPGGRSAPGQRRAPQKDGFLGFPSDFRGETRYLSFRRPPPNPRSPECELYFARPPGSEAGNRWKRR